MTVVGPMKRFDLLMSLANRSSCSHVYSIDPVLYPSPNYLNVLSFAPCQQEIFSNSYFRNLAEFV